MTPQEHIDSIGDAIQKVETAHAKLGELIEALYFGEHRDLFEGIYERLGKHINRLHRKLNRAQKAYATEHGNDDEPIVLYAVDDGAPGGTDKPDDGDPDEPVEP